MWFRTGASFKEIALFVLREMTKKQNNYMTDKILC